MMEGISFDMHWNTWVTGMRAMHAVTLTCFSVRTVHIKANPLHHNRISSKSLYHSLPLNGTENSTALHTLSAIMQYHTVSRPKCQILTQKKVNKIRIPHIQKVST